MKVAIIRLADGMNWDYDGPKVTGLSNPEEEVAGSKTQRLQQKTDSGRHRGKEFVHRHKKGSA